MQHNQTKNFIIKVIAKSEPSLFCYAIFYSSIIIHYFFTDEKFLIKEQRLRLDAIFARERSAKQKKKRTGQKSTFLFSRLHGRAIFFVAERVLEDQPLSNRVSKYRCCNLQLFCLMRSIQLLLYSRAFFVPMLFYHYSQQTFFLLWQSNLLHREVS